MTEAEIAELKTAVERAHHCPATYRAQERVREQQRQFEVALFDILGHPRALVCYAWYAESEGGKARRPVTVLREGPIYSSIDAVRLSLEEE
jgi:hypothetical protein